MKIAILGFGLQGQSVYRHFRGSNNQITVCTLDTIIDLPDDVGSQSGETYLYHLDRFDTIFRSPSIHPRDIVEANGSNILEKVTTNTNEFLKLCPTQQIIGVTGTKGKGTTSTLISKMLQAYGFKVHLGGNIGTPPLDLLTKNIQAEDWVVLELANFQLIDLKSSPRIAVCLAVDPEHLDWHIDVDEYYGAKTQLFRHQRREDIAIYYAMNENSRRIASTSPAKLIPYYSPPGATVADDQITIDGIPVIALKDIKLAGKHNWQNICAAVTTVWQIKQDADILNKVLRSFEGLPFRIEKIAEKSQIKYFNDSFASAPTATIAAIDTIKGPKILIVGGRDRGLDMNDLVKSINGPMNNVKKVLIIGEAAQRVAEELKKGGFKDFEIVNGTMNDIVKRARDLSISGDNIVLSPGFPSFDMFQNFEDRGRQFNQAVSAL